MATGNWQLATGDGERLTASGKTRRYFRVAVLLAVCLLAVCPAAAVERTEGLIAAVIIGRLVIKILGEVAIPRTCH